MTLKGTSWYDHLGKKWKANARASVKTGLESRRLVECSCHQVEDGSLMSNFSFPLKLLIFKII